MNGDGYRNVLQLTPETTNEELRKLYAEWYQDYDKVSIGYQCTFVRVKYCISMRRLKNKYQ